MPPDQGPERIRTIAAVFLVLLGLGLMTHPLYAWPHYGEESYPLFAEELSDRPDQYVEFEALPAEIHPKVRAAIDEGEVRVWSGEDAAAYDTLQDMDLIDDRVQVRYRGSYYRLGMYYTTDADFVSGFLRWLLTAGAAFLVLYGVMVHRGGSWRPFTPRRSLWLPALVTVSFYATNAYDVTYGGTGGSVLAIRPGLLNLIPIATLFFVVASEVLVNGASSRRLKFSGAGAALVGVGSLTVIHPAAFVAMFSSLVVFGLPWFAFGYALTELA